MNDKDERVSFGLGMMVVIGVIFISLFAHWEPSGETWYYWFFSRIAEETGRFCIPDRSPLYTVYLELFRWIGYPHSVTIEYFVTTLITDIALICLFRPYFRFPFLILSCILWIPLMQVWEPPVQKLALACLCFAAVLREGKPQRFQYALSYTLLILAMMFRVTSIVAIGVFLCWDIWAIYRSRASIKTITPRSQDWPVVLVIVLGLWFSMMQSPHPWNNANGASARWSPAKEQSLRDASFLQRANEAYIYKTYGNSKEKDWFNTNKEIFGNASTMPEAIKANPKFFASFLFRNIKNLLTSCSCTTLLPDLIYAKCCEKFSAGSKWWYLYHILVTFPIIYLVFYGAFRQAVTGPMACLLAVNIFMLLTTALSYPSMRYMFPMIPVLLLSSAFYLKKIGGFGINPFSRGVLSVLLILAFSSGTNIWVVRSYQLAGDILHRHLKVLEVRVSERHEDISMKASKSQLESLIQNCTGIMTNDSLFLGSFTDVPIGKFYTLWEIPPFGSLGNTAYDGLRPQRIDCILTSDLLPIESESSHGTNALMRYDHYIVPYVQQLHSLGAKTWRIPAYGYATVLKHQ